MKKTYLWLPLLVIGLCATSCTPTASKEEPGTMEKVEMKEQQETQAVVDPQIVEALESLFKWYIGRPDNARITTGYNADELAIVENKNSFLAALRSTGHFTAGFVDRLEKEYADCEKQYGAEDLDEHLPCLEMDPVTFSSGFDNFSAVEVIKVEKTAEKAIAEIILKGTAQLSADATQDRNAALKVTLISSDGNWKADQISDNE